MLDALVDTLSTQEDVSYTLLDIDNSSNQYHSIREAFNDRLPQVHTKYTLFLHQDIRFLHKHALCDFMLELEKLEPFGVVGVAGCREGKHWDILSTIVHGNDAAPAGKSIREATVIQSVDECMFAMPTQLAQSLAFSMLSGWHLYAVEQCLRTADKGLDNYVVPAAVYHLSSGGSLDASYFTTLLELKTMYPSAVGILNTTVKQWDLSSTHGHLYICYYYWKQKCKKLLKQFGLLKGY